MLPYLAADMNTADFCLLFLSCKVAFNTRLNQSHQMNSLGLKSALHYKQVALIGFNIWYGLVFMIEKCCLKVIHFTSFGSI